MGRSPCCSKQGMNRGAWTSLEDKILTDYIQINGQGRWRELPKKAGLSRCGKSCRLRWLNYLRPDIKRGNFTEAEEELIFKLHKLLGNRWSMIAGRLPGRTDNEIKNYWNTNLVKRTEEGSSKSGSRKIKRLKRGQSEERVTSQKVLSVKAVRTKAYRCTKVFITPQPELIYSDVNRPFCPIEEMYTPRILPDTDVGDPCLSDLVDSGVYHQFGYENISTNGLSLFDWGETGCSSGFHSLSFLNPEEVWLQD